jgi:hypothetical protein
MADAKKEPTAEEQVAAAEAALEAARAKLDEARGEVRTQIYREVPQMVVRVKPNAHVVHEGKSYHGAEYGIRADDTADPPDRMFHGEDSGTDLTLDGPTAFALVLEGAVDILHSEGVSP